MKKSILQIKVMLVVALLIAPLSAQVSAHGAVESETTKPSLPYYQSAEFTPQWLADDSPKLNNFHQISDFSFTNQLGETVTNKTFENKIYVASFFFTTCPGICPKMRSQLAKVQEKFRRDDQVLMLSHSIQPSNDTVEVLQTYALENKVQEGKWHLVTGEQSEIYQIARQDYFANEDLGEYVSNNDFLHTENIVLIDKNRHIRGIYNGLNNTSVSMLLEDIETLRQQ